MYKKREPHSRGSLLTLTLNSVDDVWRKCRKNAVYVIFCMDVQIDRLGQIQAEDTHNGLCVDDVASGYQIEIYIKLCNIIYKGFHFLDRIQTNFDCS